MRLRVEHLGPLREADVDLSQNLIVLTGPNNMGKTWFAWTVYALVRGARHTKLPPSEAYKLTRESPKLTLRPEQYEPLAESLVAETAAKVTRELADVFASTRAFFASTRLQWTVPAREIKQDDRAPDGRTAMIEIDISKGSDAVYAEWSQTPVGMLVELVASALVRVNKEEPPLDIEETASTVNFALSFLCRVTLGLSGDTTLFPAERLAVNLFARELAASRSELVDEALEAEEKGLDPAAVIRRAGRFPMPIRDSLSTASRLDRLSRRESPFADLAEELERTLLGGAVRATERGELHFAPHGSEVSLPVHMSASVVKSLASLTFYFRHLAQRGAFLIIDEPELNLHPDAQRKVARFLGKVINRGFKVMISTHSDFVVRELGHLVMLGNAGEEGRALARELGYDVEALLTPEKVGAWLFNEGTATRIPVDGSGFGVRTIDDEIAQMSADSQRIYARLLG